MMLVILAISWSPKMGGIQKGDINPTVSGSPKQKETEKLHSPCSLRFPKAESKKNSSIKPTTLGSPEWGPLKKPALPLKPGKKGHMF